MIGLAKRKVAVVAYDPKWPQHFDDERKELQGALEAAGICNAAIEHVGSTAIRDLAAKPIIDIAIGLQDRTDVSRTMKALLASGRDYVKAANQPGMLFLAKGSPRQYHYHLVVFGTAAWTKLIVFRDYLRRHPGIAAEYGKLKMRLAKNYPESRLQYTRHKRQTMLAMLNRAYWEARRRRHAASIRRLVILQQSKLDSHA